MGNPCGRPNQTAHTLTFITCRGGSCIRTPHPDLHMRTHHTVGATLVVARHPTYTFKHIYTVGAGRVPARKTH